LSASADQASPAASGSASRWPAPSSPTPRVVIFDEATSALDYESERAIQQNMKQIAAGRTVFIIAHRLSAVRTADRIITLEAGRVVEDGTHDQLLHSNGRYAKLHFLRAGIHGVR
jgi:subfamily B ATP-binding cassette protein HlyB/CyaB